MDRQFRKMADEEVEYFVRAMPLDMSITAIIDILIASWLKTIVDMQGDLSDEALEEMVVHLRMDILTAMRIHRERRIAWIAANN